ncbi:MAG: tetratricopeptide repeat protein [Lewinellaceae bacterium]|nr:tetratricopeptide repeat protein [Lewinellaceae bacterium]
MVRITLLFCLSVMLFTGLSGQQTTRFTEPYEPLKRGQDWMDLGLFHEAQRSLDDFLHQRRPAQEILSLQQEELAGLMMAQAGIRSDDPQGERNLLEFARSSSPDPMGNQALLEAADFYFNARDYGQAIHFYEMVNLRGMGETQRSDALFKKGYCHFVRKEFAKAKSAFSSIRDVRNDFYYPTNYYYGMTQFFEGDYDDAIISFRRVESSPKYAKYMPYVISQILFAQQKYDELIAYAELKIDGSVENEAEIRQLLGRCYFEKGEYTKALPHLAYYADRNGSMQAADFYQLGYCQYQSGQYDQSIKNLEPLSRSDDELGQQALFILGDAYLKSGDKVAARNAFRQVAKMSHVPALAEESLFLFAKLSYDVRADREAITALSQIPEKSSHHLEAQTMLGNLLVKTGDIEYALDYLSEANLKTPQLKEAYQKVHYRKAIQLRQEGNPESALPYLKKSLSAPVDLLTKTLATFQLGDLYHQAGDYRKSIDELGKFLTLAKTVDDLPEESSIALANYIQGYNFLKTDNHNRALGYFQEAVAGIKTSIGRIRSSSIRNNVLGDAIIRTGDCYFKNNRYPEALKFYHEAIESRYAGFHYAQYQSALILGLQGKPYDKVIELEQLISSFPNSDFADDALYEIGNTYLELGKMKEAVAPFSKLVKSYRKTSDLVNAAYLKLGLIAYNQGDLQEAIRQYKLVLTNNPDENERRACLAALEEIYVRDLSSPDDYLALLEKSGYNVSDSSRDSLNFKSADNLYESGAYEKAIQAYTQYLDRYPNGVNVLQAHFRRAESHSVLKQFDEALADYEEVIGRGVSRYYEVALDKAAIIAYNHQRDYTKAFTYYQLLEEAAGDEVTRFEAQLGSLRSAYRIGREDDVLAMADKVLANQQVNTSQKGQAMFYKGKVLYDRKQFDLAMPLLKEVVVKVQNELKGESHFLIADIYFKQRQFDLAREWCLQSNQKIPEYEDWVARCVLLLSDIFVEEKDLFNARAALEGLLDNYQGDETIRQAAKDRLAQIGVLENKANRLVIPEKNGLLELQEESDQ